MIFSHKWCIVGYGLSNVGADYIKAYITPLITHQRLVIVMATGRPVPSCTLQSGGKISHTGKLSHKYLSLCLRTQTDTHRQFKWLISTAQNIPQWVN